jgi:hypothetical protein
VKIIIELIVLNQKNRRLVRRQYDLAQFLHK